MGASKYPLLFLIPYLGRYRYRIALGSLMVLATVFASMLSPWVLKYVIDGLKENLARHKLPFYA